MNKKYYRYELCLNTTQEQWLTTSIQSYQCMYEACVQRMRKRQGLLYEQKRYCNASKQEKQRMAHQRRYP